MEVEVQHSEQMLKFKLWLEEVDSKGKLPGTVPQLSTEVPREITAPVDRAHRVPIGSA